MFGLGEKRKVTKAAQGIVDIVDFNASQLGLRAVNGLPGELAGREIFLSAMMGFVFATCEVLGVDNRKTLYVVLQALFPYDLPIAMKTIERAAKNSKAERAFNKVHSHLASLGGTADPSDNRDMLFLVNYMRPKKSRASRVKKTNKPPPVPKEEPKGESTPDYGMDNWEEYSSICQEAASERIPPSFEEQMTWDEWYNVFKTAAANANSQLQVTEDGVSFLDFMDHEPLKRAYSDGVDPEYLAAGFAAEFEMSDFLK